MEVVKSMKKLSNEELATAIQNGNNELLPVLWEQTERLIKKIIIKHTKSRILPNSVDLDDLLQVGYFALLTAVNSFKKDRIYKFNTYLEYSVQNAINDELGRKKQFKEYSYNKKVLNSDGDEVELLNFVEDETAKYDMFEPIELTDTQRIVIEVVEKLPPVQKEIIKKHYFQGYTLNQIAELNHCSVENIRRYERKAFRTLRANQQLKELYGYTKEHKYLAYNSFKYSPEYFEVIRKAEQIERKYSECMSYGKLQLRKFLLLYNAEQEFKKQSERN